MKVVTYSLKAKIAIFFINITILILVGFFQYQYQLHNIKDKFLFNIKNVINQELSNKLSTINGVIISLGSFHKASSDVTTSDFSTISNDLFNNYNFITAITFAPIIHEEDRKNFLEEMRDTGFYNYEISTISKDNKIINSTQTKERYAPIIYIAPSSYKYSRFVGLDVYNIPGFHDSFVKASKTDKVIILDGVKDDLGNILNLFIKSTYKGDISSDTAKYKFENTNGFYIINVDLNKILSQIKNKFSNYDIKILTKQEYFEYLNTIKNSKSNYIYELEYHEKIKNFKNNYLYVIKHVTLDDFNLIYFFSLLLAVVLIQFLYILVWHKDKKSKKLLSYKATHDELTGLTNRTYFKQIFDQKIQTLKNNRDSCYIVILFIDLDRFKELNDSFGHKFGDEVLIEISKRFKKSLRSSDIICRHGGDEFLILLDKIKDLNVIRDILDKLMQRVSEPIYYNNQKIRLTTSIGVSFYPNDGEDIDELLKNADSAMYKAKDEGRNTFRFYTKDMSFEVIQKITMENKIRDAIDKDEFLVYYQPQFDGRTDKLVGLEALVRWEDPMQKDLVPPYSFIPIAESTGLIIELDRLVMNKAIKQLVTWHKKGIYNGQLSLNLSTKQLGSEDFIKVLKEIINNNNCSASLIELEITEGEIMQNPSASIEKLRELSSYGFKLSVDDFGTGYSSLAYLKRLPINKLKIDREFVKELPNNEDDVAITKSIIALAKSLKLDLIAEGVENKEQKDFLTKLGCHKIQGYYYGKPMESKEIELLIKKTSS